MFLSQNDLNFIQSALVEKVNTMLHRIVDANNATLVVDEEKPKETKKKGETK